MRTLIGVPLAILLLLAGGGCNRKAARRIGMVPKGRTHVFWQSVHAGAVKAAREKHVELDWNGPESETDFTGQLQIVDAMLNRHMNAVALAPVDRKALVNVVDRASRDGVPVIIFDSPIDTQNFVAQVATDNYHAGEIAARRVIELLGGSGQAAMVATQAGAASTMAREQGFEDTIRKSAPGIRIVDKRYGNSDVAQALSVAENMLTAYPQLGAMFASNESSTEGAAQAVKARGGKVKLVGFDSSPSLLDNLTAGTIDSLVVQDPFKMGYDTVIAAVEKLDGGSPAKIQNIDPLVVTRANLNDPNVHARLFPDLKKYLD